MKNPALTLRVICFGIFEFSPQTGELRRLGLKVKLEPQASKILALLLEYPGKICTRQELQQHLWQDNTLVDFERSLYKGIHTLRGTLGDSAIAPREVRGRHGKELLRANLSIQSNSFTLYREQQGLCASAAFRPPEALLKGVHLAR